MKQEVEVDFRTLVDEKDMEISILPGESPEKDFEDYINAMNVKFKFKNKDKFREDILNLIQTIDPNATLDLDNFGNNYYQLIAAHSSEPDLAINEEGAIKEIQNIMMTEIKNG